MQPAAETGPTFSLERKLKLHEARELIINRLALTDMMRFSVFLMMSAVESEPNSTGAFSRTSRARGLASPYFRHRSTSEMLYNF